MRIAELSSSRTVVPEPSLPMSPLRFLTSFCHAGGALSSSHQPFNTVKPKVDRKILRESPMFHSPIAVFKLRVQPKHAPERWGTESGSKITPRKSHVFTARMQFPSCCHNPNMRQSAWGAESGSKLTPRKSYAFTARLQFSR